MVLEMTGSRYFALQAVMISIITLFEKHFGYTHESHIFQTYRFNEEPY